MFFRVPTTFFCALFVLALAVSIHADITVNPGETSPPLQAEDCASATGGPFGDCLEGCNTNCVTSENQAQAYLDISNFNAGVKFSQIGVYSDFHIEGGSNPGATVSTTLNYDVEWNGIWALTGVFAGYNDVKITIQMVVSDLTESKIIKTETVHSFTADGFASLDVIDVGLGRDKGSFVSAIAFDGIRGHTYRAQLRMRLEGKGALNAVITLDYYATPGLGAWWNEMTVTVAPDLAELIAELSARVDTLEARVDSLEEENEQLREDLENHTHKYLTGRGEGHNNTEAETSPAIIMEEPDQDEISDIFPDDKSGATSQPLPVSSVALTNYPNPFNPTTTIQFSLPTAEHVTIRIYNTLGQLVQTLVDESKSAGVHTVPFDAGTLATGVYYYRLVAGEFIETRKLTLLK